MDIKIGMQHVARELSLEVDTTTEDFRKRFEDALTQGETLQVEDVRGWTYLLNPTLVAYLEFSRDGGRRVGFA